MLLYTGLRYHQLADWQSKIFPQEIVGGLKGRNPSTIPTALRFEIDNSQRAGDALVGVKLDKSKAFDRLIPGVAAMLFLAFGLPVGLAVFFQSLFNRLKKLAYYNGWCNSQPITAPNGLIQGCSLSILAMNLHQLVWITLFRQYEHIHIRAHLWTIPISGRQLAMQANWVKLWSQLQLGIALLVHLVKHVKITSIQIFA